jgi:hypothetical protein
LAVIIERLSNCRQTRPSLVAKWHHFIILTQCWYFLS